MFGSSNSSTLLIAHELLQVRSYAAAGGEVEGFSLANEATLQLTQTCAAKTIHTPIFNPALHAKAIRVQNL